ncbi:hypothetical protein [Actinomycetospora atypica]|uniref:Uncharacterized protein n=1 Tax=Actinomycetospora atypica TaxID=1290095 RepID=A0ABV9YE00_9PSEU
MSEPTPPEATTDRPGGLARLGADWIAVIVAGILVLLAGTGLLPTIPFLIK